MLTLSLLYYYIINVPQLISGSENTQFPLTYYYNLYKHYLWLQFLYHLLLYILYTIFSTAYINSELFVLYFGIGMSVKKKLQLFYFTLHLKFQFGIQNVIKLPN